MRIVDGVLKEYAWGRVDGLTPWCSPTGGPQAELWFGAHPGGPSPIIDEPGRTLADAEDLTGLPMVKILAAAAPLSIQVHPDARQAAAGYAAQRQGSSEPALYADDAEKSEMLIALTTFDTHAGWRDPGEAADLLQRAGLEPAAVEVIATGTRADAIRVLLDLDDLACRRIVDALIPAAVAAHWRPESVSALARVAAVYPGDRGVLVCVLMQHYSLAPGEALAVPAGVVHSYVEGLAVEVMTSSDNVLRLGLTAKPIAIPQALAALRGDRTPMVLAADAVLQPPELPFRVQFLGGDAPDSVHAGCGTARIVVALSGTVQVGEASFGVGSAGVLGALEPSVDISTDGRAVVVTTRVRSEEIT